MEHQLALPGPTVSVALSVYNAGRYLDAQLESILNQTHLPQQIVVGDDGSTDGSHERVVRAAEQSRHRGLEINWTILPPGSGDLHRNMARIFDSCTQDIIVICDHDDVNLPNRIARTVECFSSDPNLLFLHSDAEVIDGDGHVTARSMTRAHGLNEAELVCMKDGKALDLLLRKFVVAGATCAFRKNLRDIIAPIPENTHHDYWFALLSAAISGYSYDHRPSIQYRVHGKNESGGVRRRGLVEKFELLRVPGNERNQRLLARATNLAKAADDLGDAVAEDSKVLLRDSMAFQEWRVALPKNRLVRAPHVLRQARTDKYARFGRGRKDVLLDLVQPAL